MHEKEKAASHKAKGIVDSGEEVGDRISIANHNQRKPHAKAAPSKSDSPNAGPERDSLEKLGKEAVANMDKANKHHREHEEERSKKESPKKKHPYEIKLENQKGRAKHVRPGEIIRDKKPVERPTEEEEHVNIIHSRNAGKSSVRIEAHGEKFHFNLKQSSRKLSDIAVVMLGLPEERQTDIKSKLEVCPST